MNISVFGMGYVGCVASACLANEGHTVIGVDVSPEKVSLLQRGKSPIKEKGLPELIQKTVAQKTLTATTNAKSAIDQSSISLICVGTPSNKDGSANLEYVEHVIKEIASVLRQKKEYHLIVIRSTVPPGTSEVLQALLAKQSGKKAGKDFGFCMNPEFLRMGSSIKDFYEPPFTVIGQLDKKSGDTLDALYKSLPISGSIHRLDLQSAEAFKYLNNTFHGLKVAFANEVGRLSTSLGVDGLKLMQIFCEDTKQNISPYYLRPGMPFGGSCLPKDIKSLEFILKKQNVQAKVMQHILESNEDHFSHIHSMIEKTKGPVGFLGITFKAQTDDMRSSPTIVLMQKLSKAGRQVFFYDADLTDAHLLGANKEFLLSTLPLFEDMQKKSLKDLCSTCSVLVLGNTNQAYLATEKYLTEKHTMIDGTGMFLGKGLKNYLGIGW